MHQRSVIGVVGMGLLAALCAGATVASAGQRAPGSFSGGSMGGGFDELARELGFEEGGFGFGREASTTPATAPPPSASTPKGARSEELGPRERAAVEAGREAVEEAKAADWTSPLPRDLSGGGEDSALFSRTLQDLGSALREGKVGATGNDAETVRLAEYWLGRLSEMLDEALAGLTGAEGLLSESGGGGAMGDALADLREIFAMLEEAADNFRSGSMTRSSEAPAAGEE